MQNTVMKSTIWLVALVTCLGIVRLCAEEPTADAIQKAANQLGDSKLATREAASDFLWRAGLPAEPALLVAAKSTDAETRYRARAILEKFKVGLFADTSPEVVEIIRSYRNGDQTARRQAIQKLQMNRDLRTIMALLRAERDENLRKEFQQQLSQDVELMITPLLVAGEFEKVAPMLELGAATDIGKCQLATYFLLRGQLDKQISEFQTRFKDKEDKEIGRQLVFLLRAKGDWAAARLIAQQMQDINLEVMLLAEMGDWKNVAQMGEDHWTKIQFSANYQLSERLGFMTAYHRLAGNQESYRKGVEELKAQAAQDKKQGWAYAKALFLNDKPDEGMELIREATPALAFQFLCFQHRYREAFDFAGLKEGTAIDQAWYESLPDEKVATTHYMMTRFSYAIHVLRALHTVGRHDDMNQLAALLAKQIISVESGEQRVLWTQLAETEYRSGMTEKAFEHAARTMVDPDSTRVLNRLFFSRSTEADVWWKYFRGISDDPADISGKPERERLAKVEEVLKSIPSSKLADDPLRKLAVDAMDDGSDLEGEKRIAWFTAIGESCATRGHKDLAMQAFEKVADQSAVAALRFGDLRFEDKEFAKAAELYSQAWKQDPKVVVALFLSAISLEKAGKGDEARAQLEKANYVALTARSRYFVATALQQRELTDEALRQAEIVLRTAPLGDKLVDDSCKLIGDMIAAKEPARAAELLERQAIGCLRSNIWFTSADSYLRVPANVHRIRAIGLVAGGDKAGALREIELALADSPGDVTTAEELVPALDKAGDKGAADELFDKTFEFQSKLCKEFPKSAMHLNNIAWIAARSQRRLDDALEYSKRALELSPNTAAYVDTMGEVRFRRGEIDEAIECAKRTIDMNPKFKFYREQLERFEKAKM